MPPQLTLPGFEAAPQPYLHSLFIAAYPPPKVARAAMAQARCLNSIEHLDGQLMQPQRLHVTLEVLQGSVAVLSPAIIAQAQRAARSLSAAAFQLRFDTALSMGGGAYTLSSKGQGTMEALTFIGQLNTALRKVGVRAEPITKPHMTLLYTRAVKVPEHQVEPMEWTVQEFRLIHSHVGKSIHEVLGQWTLH